MTHLPAPYEGYIKAVPARVGDQVAEGQVLVELDTSELFLEEASSLAQLQRYQSEAEKAENENRLADMRVARAMRKQTQASLDLTRHRLAQAQVKAPFAGIIVAGDLRDRLGSPVKTGEIMMRLTRLEDLYIEMKVAERDIHEILDSADGEISFVSKPDQTFAFAIDRIEPAAVAEQGGNNFIARALPQNPAESWWRPGMTGVAKINVGDRTLFWIFTHRLVDFLRMKLWW
ncbi:MAG: efflux RND transporter periplasmic adaptor subunit [Verrucomicrobiales bacterium]